MIHSQAVQGIKVQVLPVQVGKAVANTGRRKFEQYCHKSMLAI